MKTKLIALTLAAVCSGVGAVTADELIATTIYPPQGPAITLFRRVPEKTTIAVYRAGHGAGRQMQVTEANSDTKLVTRSLGNGQPVSYFERAH